MLKRTIIKLKVIDILMYQIYTGYNQQINIITAFKLQQDTEVWISYDVQGSSDNIIYAVGIYLCH